MKGCQHKIRVYEYGGSHEWFYCERNENHLFKPHTATVKATVMDSNGVVGPETSVISWRSRGESTDRANKEIRDNS